jgi:hypothetical protein
MAAVYTEKPLAYHIYRKDFSVRIQAPLYDGDSIIRYGPSTPPAPTITHREADSTPETLQRTIASAEPMTRLDIAAIEARARALRAEAIADLARRAWQWLATASERARRRREEEYLARAQSHAELEYRLRKLERSGQLIHI